MLDLYPRLWARNLSYGVLGAAGVWWPIRSSKPAGRSSPPIGWFDSIAAPWLLVAALGEVARVGGPQAIDELDLERSPQHQLTEACVVRYVHSAPVGARTRMVGRAPRAPTRAAWGSAHAPAERLGVGGRAPARDQSSLPPVGPGPLQVGDHPLRHGYPVEAGHTGGEDRDHLLLASPCALAGAPQRPGCQPS